MPRPKILERLRKPGSNPTSEPVPLVVGLRNPGSEYEGTRHNAGYEVVARVLHREGLRLGRAPSRLRAQIAQSGAGEDRVVYAVPTTYMNHSGSAVRALLDYFGLSPVDLLVVHDDIDLAFGRLKLQVGGGSGGHNGIKSIESALGTKDFSRLKFGVGRPPGDREAADHVLRRFSKSELAEVEAMVEDAAEIVAKWPHDRAQAQEMAALRGRGRDG